MESDRSTSGGRAELKPLTSRAILTSAATILVLGAVAATLLLIFLGGGQESDRNRLDAIRTASSIVIGTGGAAALLLAARRQRYTELALLHQYELLALQRDTNAAVERDASERRVIESFTKAADQLGSSQAPVRLAGLYALERLAEAEPAQRATVMKVVCAYLRMPYRPPASFPHVGPPTRSSRKQLSASSSTAASDMVGTPVSEEEERARAEELEVRMVAQWMVVRHIKYLGRADDEGSDNWGAFHLDLSGATLMQFTMSYREVKSADFTGATFYGNTVFEGSVFRGRADFRDCDFRGLAWFDKTSFEGMAVFSDSVIEWPAMFMDATFEKRVSFGDLLFKGGASFTKARFLREVDFKGTCFQAEADFEEVEVVGPVEVSGMSLVRDAEVRHRLPVGWQPRSTTPDDGIETAGEWVLVELAGESGGR